MIHKRISWDEAEVAFDNMKKVYLKGIDKRVGGTVYYDVRKILFLIGIVEDVNTISFGDAIQKIKNRFGDNNYDFYLSIEDWE